MSLCSVERDLKMGHGDLCVSRHFELGSIERIPQVSLDFALSSSGQYHSIIHQKRRSSCAQPPGCWTALDSQARVASSSSFVDNLGTVALVYSMCALVTEAKARAQGGLILYPCFAYKCPDQIIANRLPLHCYRT